MEKKISEKKTWCWRCHKIEHRESKYGELVEYQERGKREEKNDSSIFLEKRE